jgi:hypothetical protein
MDVFLFAILIRLFFVLELQPYLWGMLLILWAAVISWQLAPNSYPDD